ncbi:MAG: NAD-dependent DNA ligase LigA [Candidatus Paceibacterota bacterium]
MNNIEELRKKLVIASYYYYNEQPTMSDDEYDGLKEQLKKLSPSDEVLKLVGAPVPGTAKKVEHRIPMGSLDKVVREDEFKKWAEKIGVGNFVIEEKLDGISVELVYQDGLLRSASTRGDGKVGEEIIHNMVLVQNVPVSVKHKGELCVRGELVLSTENFDQHFFNEYRNPRNTVSGLSRKKGFNPLMQHMSFVCHDVLVSVSKESDKLVLARNLGFEVVKYHVVGVDNAIKWYDKYVTELRDECEYEIDGLVVKCNDLSISAQEDLDSVIQSGTPKYQIAWKFPSQTSVSVIRAVEWSVGVGGRITPVAIIDPTDIGGVTITRVNLHNLSNIQSLGLKIGSTVSVSRRNDVIPHIEKVLLSGEGEAIGVSVCPECGEKISWVGEFVECHNPACKSKLFGDLKKWIQVMELDQLGDSFIEDAINRFGVCCVADLYKIPQEVMTTFEGYGPSKANTIISSIQSKKKVSLPKFMAALNIGGVSESTFSLLYDNGFDTLDKLYSATVCVVDAVPGIGHSKALAIFDGISKKKMDIELLLVAGIEIEEKSNDTSLPLCGMSFCFTGALSIKRSSAEKLVKKLGGDVKSTVTKGLTYLVQADPNSTSSKSVKARQNGTKIINEDGFVEITGFSIDAIAGL